MKLSKITTMITVVLAATAMTALGDWDVGDPYKMHFPQLPDLDNGMNVLAVEPLILADDFLCTETGPITDIHLWGSWLDDIFPNNSGGVADPGEVAFHLSIHSDIPANAAMYSTPGELLWEMDFLPGSFRNRPWATSTERFFDPLNNVVIGFDTHVIQYNFLIDPADAFVQTAGEIYWLDVQAFVITPEPATLSLLAMGGLAMLKRRRRR